jgi:hypothetical protein
MRDHIKMHHSKNKIKEDGLVSIIGTYFEIAKIKYYKHKYLVSVSTQKSPKSPKSERLKLENKVTNKKFLFYYSKNH